MAIANHWYQQIKTNETRYKNDYRELYINNIRKLLLEQDTTRPFAGSSPTNGLESQKENWIAKNPSDNRYGDVHYYNYRHPLWDWKLFPSAKFASEFGFESYPSLETLAQVIDEKDLTFPISTVVAHHQHHPGGVQQMEKMICMLLNFSTLYFIKNLLTFNLIDNMIEK